ncbi:Multidrug efflux pump subunit AcrB [Paenibacillus algorifonticola]|uniref:Multidrug efflux pump subunit AcrB n=1 Tax=Paenibacillus algorifonticola TaxID=684063 RepID=A0A1I2BAZ5_9BACL|nr:efflux RND transporter permease subunit [Paenibacillus algorifonticola]SFE53315.1 Multidrug efflux pump subunit AcrB [Paenibacillus algorifonticola]
MNRLTKFSLKNSVAVILLCALVLGYGLYASTQIKQQTFPDLDFPAVFVQAIQPGASTEEIESEVAKPIEDNLKRVQGYESLTSTSSENAASIFIQFPFGTDMDKKYSEVEAELNKLKLSDNANVTVQRLSANSQPIYQAAVFAAEGDSAKLADKLQNTVVPELQKLAGVGNVTLKGGTTNELSIVVDKNKAAQHGITLSSIRTALQALDYALPLGTVSQEETVIPIRLTGSLDSLKQLEALKLTATAGGGAAGSATGSAGGAGAGGVQGNVANQAAAGSAAGTASGNAVGAGAGIGASSGSGASSGAGAAAAITLGDIADIKSVSEQNEITRFNGEPSFVISIQKTQDANTADVSDNVRELLTTYQDTGELDYHVIVDQGQEIKESVSGLIREGLYGTLFCVLIIFLFLRNVRATIISILSLPISIFATIAIMDQMGYTLNIMTLGGIAVSVGRIVDDSIVVIENIYRWRQEKGEKMSGKELAYQATREVIGAVASSTAATIVVFAPLAFVSGIIGQFFRPFSIAVVLSISISLLVSMMLIPVLGSFFFRNVKPHTKESRLSNGFEKIIRSALKRKALVLGSAVVLLVGSLGMIPLIGVAFLPTSATPSLAIDVALPAQSSLKQTDDVSGKVEAYLSKQGNVESYEVSVGGAGANPLLSSGGNNKATITVQFAEGSDMAQLTSKLQTELLTVVTAEQVGTTLNIKAGEQQGPPSGNNIDVSIYSDSADKLAQTALQIENLMNESSDLKDITNNMDEVTPKWVISLNQSGIDDNISPYLIMQLTGEQLRPVDAGTYKIDNKEQAIILSYKQQIATKEELENIQIPTAAGMKKLKDIADITEQNTWIKVSHDDGKMYALVSGAVKDASAVSAVTKQVQADIDSLTLPSGVELKVGGGLQMINDGFSSLGIAMAAAIGLVFIIMSMTFGGLRTPLIILASLVFIPIGSLSALLLSGQSLSMSGMIGMLMLVGIVVTNAVVLLDRVEKNRKAGIPITEAIVEAARTRLRPILMTAFATMLALVPLALSGSSTSLISGGLAITVIGGLFSSTVLTLIVMPVIYEMVWKKHKVIEADAFNDYE